MWGRRRNLGVLLLERLDHEDAVEENFAAVDGSYRSFRADVLPHFRNQLADAFPGRFLLSRIHAVLARRCGLELLGREKPCFLASLSGRLHLQGRGSDEVSARCETRLKEVVSCDRSWVSTSALQKLYGLRFSYARILSRRGFSYCFSRRARLSQMTAIYTVA